MKAMLQWLLLSACIVALYWHAYGRKRGVLWAMFFVVVIGIFIWALNRSGKQDE